VTLEVDGDGALYSLPLPEVMYQGCVRKDLGDLRIFNGYGEVVPHLLQREQQANAARSEPVALNFFPLFKERSWEEEVQHIRIADDGKGTIIDIERRPPGEISGANPITHYLVDASPLEGTVEKLLLDWHGGGDGVLVSVRVEYSNDLVHWRHLVAAATLADLSYEGYSLGQREISLPRQEARYYRISWPLGEKGAQLKGIQAQVVRAGDMPPHQWRTLTAAGSETRPGEYTFVLPGNYPLDSVRVLLPQANTVVQAKLLSRNDDKTPWRVRHQGLLYTLQREGHTLSSDPIALPMLNDSFWLLEVEQGGGGIGSGAPQLEVGWIPHRLVFAARGEMPFTLAFGAAAVEAPDNSIAELLHRLEQRHEGEDTEFIKLAHTSRRFELGGERLLQPPRPALPWKKWLLWAVLILGVLLLAGMARGLYRQMNDSDAGK
jgi:hypothetical protein